MRLTGLSILGNQNAYILAPDETLTRFDHETFRLYQNEFPKVLLSYLADLRWFDIESDATRGEVERPLSLTNESDLPQRLREIAHRLDRAGRKRSRRRAGGPRFRQPQ